MSILIAKDMLHEPLHVVVPIFNPFRYKSRIKHADRALKHFADSGAVITLVEVGFNRRDLVYADSGLNGTVASCGIGGEFRHRYIGLHTTDDAVWVKEPAINIGVQSLPYNWQNLAFIDGDVHFIRSNWVGQTAHLLQHFKWVQMFSQAFDLAPNSEVLPADYPHAQGAGLVAAWQNGDLKTTLTPQIEADLRRISNDITHLLKDFMTLEEDIDGASYYNVGPKRIWPGLAWACSRQGWEDIGSLPWYLIWGGADHILSNFLVGRTDGILAPGLHPNLVSLCMELEDRCRKLIRRNVGVMDGAVFHSWHGKKQSRHYSDKHTLLAKYQYDPLRHLKVNSQGIPVLHDDGSETYIQLRDTFRRIAHDRQEDSIDTGLNLTPPGH